MLAWLPLLVYGVPLLLLAFQWMKRRRRWREWQATAERLQLELRGNVDAFSLRGMWYDVEINIEQHVTQVYKQAPTFSYLARARIPDRRVRTLEDRAPAALPDPSVVDGWLQCFGFQSLDPKTIEALLDALAHGAASHVASQHPPSNA